MVHEMNTAAFNAAVASGNPTVVDFYATWCGPCKMLEPILEQVSEEYPTVTFGRVNVDANMDVAAELGIESIPLVLFFKDGKQADEMLGFNTAPIVAARVEKLL